MSDGAKRFIGLTLKQRLEAEGQTNHLWIHALYRMVLRPLVHRLNVTIIIHTTHAVDHTTSLAWCSRFGDVTHGSR